MARWMVSMEGSLSQEDISESMLGRVLVGTVGTADNGGSLVESTSSIISDGSTVSASNIITTDKAPTTSDPNNTTTKKAVTAVKVPQDRKHQVIVPARAPRTRSSAADPSELFGGIEELVLPPTKRSTNRKNGSSPRPRLQAGETSVVKVPLLTGTLYLYRGLSRRAEFIRHK
jgi:hypothetical protein